MPSKKTSFAAAKKTVDILGGTLVRFGRTGIICADDDAKKMLSLFRSVAHKLFQDPENKVLLGLVQVLPTPLRLPCMVASAAGKAVKQDGLFQKMSYIRIIIDPDNCLQNDGRIAFDVAGVKREKPLPDGVGGEVEIGWYDNKGEILHIFDSAEAYAK